MVHHAHARRESWTSIQSVEVVRTSCSARRFKAATFSGQWMGGKVLHCRSSDLFVRNAVFTSKDLEEIAYERGNIFGMFSQREQAPMAALWRWTANAGHSTPYSCKCSKEAKQEAMTRTLSGIGIFPPTRWILFLTKA